MWWLVTANEFFARLKESYPKKSFRNVSEYTVARSLEILKSIARQPTTFPDGVSLSAPEVFVGFLLLDAWIGNQDRHHENWAILLSVEEGQSVLPLISPSYDHAASLGQTLRDPEREQRLRVRDLGHIEFWVRKARGALYGKATDAKPLSTLEAFRAASYLYPRGAEYWLDRLSAVNPDSWVEILNRVPEKRASPLAREFAAEMLTLNRRDLLESTSI